MKANSNYEQCGTFKTNNDNYNICKNINLMFADVPVDRYYWTIIPYFDNDSYVFVASGTGEISYNAAYDGAAGGIARAYCLNSDITLSGTGTLEDPYVITN